MHIKNYRFLSSLTLVFLTACAGPPVAPVSSSLAADVLLRAAPLTGEADVPALDDVDVLALDQSMLAFLDEHVDRNSGNMLKLHSLLYAMITDGSFGLEYDEITRTAQQTFSARRGNCLSFTNMFVALAREVGINVKYQEVEIPPSWSLEDESYYLSRHVNVFVDLGAGGSREVDFNIDDFQSSYDRKVISDERALAHYYSNIGAEHLQQHRLLEALRYFRKAVASDHEFAPAWSNLGALYSQAGHFGYAEAAYLQALTINPRELVAMSNLGALYRHTGRPELADWYDRRSDLHRMRNPYYRYYLARSAFLSNDYETAIQHLKYAIRKEKYEDTFYLLLGLSYLHKGNESAARRWLEKAEEVIEEDGLKRDYHNKLERLLNGR